MDVELARQQWQEGYRRVEESRGNRMRYERLHAQLEVVSSQLRRRIGQTFTLGELATAYGRSDEWVRLAVEESDSDPGWANDVATVGDAAFHLYARGATDYVP